MFHYYHCYHLHTPLLVVTPPFLITHIHTHTNTRFFSSLSPTFLTRRQVEVDFWGKPLSAKDIRKKQQLARKAEREAAKIAAGGGKK